MNSKDLQYVLAIAHTLNFSKAAASLYVTQPALSQAVNRLEQQLGVQLFFRSRTHVALTPVGEEFVRQAGVILDQINTLEYDMRHFGQVRQKELSIGVSQFYGKHFLSRLINGLQQCIPDYQIKIIEGESHFLESLIIQKRLDFGIFPAPIYDQNMSFAPVYEEKILFAFNKKNPQAMGLLQQAYNGKSIDLKYYKDFPFILLKEGLKLHDTANQICQAYGFQPQAVFQTENLDTVYSLVANNYGVAFLPSTILQSIDSDGDVIFFPVKSKYSSRPIGLAYLKGVHTEKFLADIISSARKSTGTLA